MDGKMERLKGRTAIITGAARGLGAAFAHGLASEGAAVVLCDVTNAEPVAEEIRAAGARAVALQADVSKPEDARAAVRLAEEWQGGVQVLINNAGLFADLKARPLDEIESDEWDRVFAVNTRGTFEFAKAAVPIMRRQRYGKIINLTSSTVETGTPYLLHYVSSKGAIIAMTRAMARELGDYNICVNAISPGLTSSEGVLGNPDLRPAVELRAQQRSIKREEVPTDLVGAAVFLSSPESDFITGQTLLIDGGMIFR
jgi:NAD(P)-dependent dehydrogenase (short-subunit alcohol dehydrogenase family)